MIQYKCLKDASFTDLQSSRHLLLRHPRYMYVLYCKVCISSKQATQFLSVLIDGMPHMLDCTEPGPIWLINTMSI